MKLPTTRGHGRDKLVAIAYRANAKDRIDAGWYPVQNMRWLIARMASYGQAPVLIRFATGPISHPAEAHP